LKNSIILLLQIQEKKNDKNLEIFIKLSEPQNCSELNFPLTTNLGEITQNWKKNSKLSKPQTLKELES